MLGALVIVFREVLEAGLIVGIILAITKGVRHSRLWILTGIMAGALGALLVAIATNFIAQLFDGTGQELFNAGILFFAVLMLAWHSIWMSAHGREMASDARRLGRAISSGEKELKVLATVVALTVLREGSEVVLFLYGIMASEKQKISTILAGSSLGLAFGAIFSFLVYRGLMAIPLKYFFRATSTLITLLAGGLASQAVLFLQQAGFIDSLTQPVWDTSRYLSETDPVGRLLHSLIGYTDRPSGAQLLAYGLTLTLIFICSSSVHRQKKYGLRPAHPSTIEPEKNLVKKAL